MCKTELRFTLIVCFEPFGEHLPNSFGTKLFVCQMSMSRSVICMENNVIVIVIIIINEEKQQIIYHVCQKSVTFNDTFFCLQKY